jgi:RNA-binding protein 5/10
MYHHRQVGELFEVHQSLSYVTPSGVYNCASLIVCEDVLGESNVGNQMLQKMGWKQGEGIGKQNVKTAPIDVYIRPDRGGLGTGPESQEASLRVEATDSFISATRKRFFGRVRNKERDVDDNQ